MNITKLKDAAIAYAQRGWPVIPLHTPHHGICSCKMAAACQSPGKHPRTLNGHKDATTDTTRITKWWTEWPDANIGVLTGAESRLVVIDVDDHEWKSGSQSLAEIEESLGETLDTLTAITGHGKHLYFVHPGGTVPNSVEKLAPGIDVRADGGYVAAPPSLHANGTRYSWIDTQTPTAELPSVIVQEMRRETHPIEQTAKASKDSSIPEGKRNDTLYKLACALRGQQAMERGQILTSLLESNTARCCPPLDVPEVIRITDSVCQHPPQHRPKKSAQRRERNPLYWFQFNTRDWLSDLNVMLMTDAQTGWYIRLKVLAWSAGGYLPSDMDQLRTIAKATSKRKFEEGCALVLAEFEEVIIEGELKLRNPELVAQHTKALADWMKKKEAGEARATKFNIAQSKQPLPIAA
jgi:uncharacterized protein YdaU (DUF1376 family)